MSREQYFSACRMGQCTDNAVAAHRADQVFLPVLENAVKAQKLRSTLGVFERSKFLFNLPGSLLESINAVSRELWQ